MSNFYFNMKIVLATIWNVANYGALLQCYGLCKYLTDSGHDVSLLDLSMSNTNILLKKLKSVTINRPFEDFKKKLPKPVKIGEHNADIYITGSDQVWNPDILGDRIYTYMLDFAPLESRKVSYAASFGNSKWKDRTRYQHAKKLLSSYNRITVREDSGVKILKDTFGIDGVQVLDPCFLIRDYYELIGRIDNSDTNNLVVFKLVQSSTWKSEISDLSKLMGCNLAELNGKYISRLGLLRGFNQKHPKVSEWLKQIAMAKWVITDSFHCMVFSIIFHKQFVILPSIRERSTRLTSLLNKLGLENRIADSVDECAEILENNIDYTIVDQKLNILKHKSIEELEKLLQI